MFLYILFTYSFNKFNKHLKNNDINFYIVLNKLIKRKNFKYWNKKTNNYLLYIYLYVGVLFIFMHIIKDKYTYVQITIKK